MALKRCFVAIYKDGKKSSPLSESLLKNAGFREEHEPKIARIEEVKSDDPLFLAFNGLRPNHEFTDAEKAQIDNISTDVPDWVKKFRNSKSPGRNGKKQPAAQVAN